MTHVRRAPFALLLAVSALQAGAVLATGPLDPPWLAELAPRACVADSAAGGRLPGFAAMQIYRDPATGRFSPPPGTVRVVLPSAVELRARPLVERRVPGPGGGVRVDLSGRHAAALTVTRGADGRLRIGCGLGPPTETGRAAVEEDRR